MESCRYNSRTISLNGAIALVISLGLPAWGDGEVPVPERVSLMRLIVDPAAYHGRKVLTRGFYSMDLERSALFISEEAADFGMGKDAMWLDFGGTSAFPADNSRRHVTVIGTVDATEHGSYRLYAGEIRVIHIWPVERLKQSDE